MHMIPVISRMASGGVICWSRVIGSFYYEPASYGIKWTSHVKVLDMTDWMLYFKYSDILR